MQYCENLSSYKGDFLSSSKLFNKSVLNKSCSFELSTTEFLQNVQNTPKWFDYHVNKKDLFSFYYKNNELDKAWLTLNSHGWILKDVKNALEILKKKSNDKLFHLIADNWIEGVEKANKENDNY